MAIYDAASDDWSALRFVLCDLDGVVWLAREPIFGAAKAIADLREGGRRVLFVTNNSVSPVAEQEAALGAIGIEAVGDVVTSAQAAASLVLPWEQVLVLGGPGVVEAVEARGATVLRGDSRGDSRSDGNGAEPDVVMVGLDREFDYRRLELAQRAIRDGARFVATNDDATFPTPHGLIPGGGAIVAAVSTAAGVQPVVAGKPHAPMAALVRERCGPDFSARTALMVGDRWATDGVFARALGCPFALVRSGVTPPGVEAGESTIDAPDLAAVARITRAS